MIEAATIRNLLSAAFLSKLGTYTFSNGLTTPAIRIDDGVDPFTEDPTVTGLEVVLAPSIAVSVRSLINGYEQTFGMDITLKQWDITKGTIPMLGIVLDMIGQYNELGTGQIKRVIRSKKLDNIETLTISVYQVFETDLNGQ